MSPSLSLLVIQTEYDAARYGDMEVATFEKKTYKQEVYLLPQSPLNQILLAPLLHLQAFLPL
jgi:hypothetical protein